MSVFVALAFQVQPKSGSTGRMGVTKKGDKFLAKIRENGKSNYLGSFDSADDAARAFDVEARKIGRRTNFDLQERPAPQVHFRKGLPAGSGVLLWNLLGPFWAFVVLLGL